MIDFGSSLTCSQHINHSGHDSLKFSFELHYFGPDLRLARTKKAAIPIQSVQNVYCRLQTADWVQNTDWIKNADCRLSIMQTENFTDFRLIHDNISPYNLPGVTQSLFRDHVLLLFALLWNIPFPVS